MFVCECQCVCCDVQVFLTPEADPAQTLVCPSCGRRLMPRKLTPFGEAEWLGCDNPALLVQWEDQRLTDRKRRLFAVACCRWVWEQLTDARSREAVELAERFADGKACAEELGRAHGKAFLASLEGGRGSPEDVLMPPLTAVLERLHPRSMVGEMMQRTAGRRSAEWAAVAALFRDVVGNPFRPVRLNPGWLAWEGGTVRKLAEAIYEEKAFERMPVLGDALEEAGCAEGSVLDHCRSPGPHARGCWVVDLLLGKG
jgi:hypothetical protein